jgi:aminoglycoside 3-N-acetyltransferase
MRKITQAQVVEILRSLGVQAGDGLLVHSAIQFLGQPQGGVAMYLEALQEVLGLHAWLQQERSPGNKAAASKTQAGCLAVPAFNFAFARGEHFHPQKTPAENMGVFSEFVRQQAQAQRTRHPMQSLAVIGSCAADLVARDTPSAFEPGSAFERMLELDFKLLLLGADVQAASIIHYSEQRADVPYRYWKDFQGLIYRDQTWQACEYRMFVRDLQADAQLDLHPIQELLQSRHQWAQRPVNYGSIAVCRLVDFVAAADEILAKDPWALVANRAEAMRAMQNHPNFSNH